MTIEQDLLNVVSSATDLTQTVQTKVTEIDAKVDQAVAETIANTNTRISQLDGELVDFKAQTAFGTPGWHSYNIDLSAGRPDRFYPVAIKFGSDSYNPGGGNKRNMIHEVQITRRFADSPKPAADNGYVNYNGVHWAGMQCKIISTGGHWDGGPSWSALTTNRHSYRPLLAHILADQEGHDGVFVWLRGGCNYNSIQSFPIEPEVFQDPLVNGIPQKVWGYTNPSYREEFWVNYAELDEVQAYYDEVQAFYAGFSSSQTAAYYALRETPYIAYNQSYDMGMDARPWDNADYQEGLYDLARAAGGVQLRNKRDSKRTSSLPIESDRRWLAGAFARSIRSTDFPEREKGVLEEFTVDEPYVTLRLADYVAPSA